MMLRLRGLYLFCLLLHVVFLAEAMRRNCGPGTYFDGEVCEPCELGTYQNVTGSTSCAPCPPGTYNPFRGAQGIDVCIPCDESTFSNATGAPTESACKLCPPGTNAPSGSTSCKSCPAGKFLSLCDPSIGDFHYYDIGMCFHCFSCASCDGTRPQCEIQRPIDLKCYDCLQGSFANKSNSLECSPCPSGLRSARSGTGCATCPAGTEATGGTCSKCRRFTFSGESNSYCRGCPAGQTANSRRGGTKCVPCPAGTFRADGKFDSNTSCRPCQPGENSFVTGATFCMPDKTPCAPNFFRSASGACLQCTERQRLDVSMNTCVDCPRNLFSKGGVSTTCEPCPLNSELSDDIFDDPCVCKGGTEQEIRSSEIKCTPCPPGSAGSSGFCSKCFPYSIAPRAGMMECVLCPSGTRQPLRGQTKCEAFSCPPGTFKRDYECIEPASNCPPGSKRVEDQYALSACEPQNCPLGLFLGIPFPFAEAESCLECEFNERYDPERRRCFPCRRTEISAGGLAQSCTACPPGELAESGQCTCRGGKMIIDGECARCPKGTSARTSGSVGCTPCAPGTISDILGCSRCRPGEFTSTAGARRCEKCAAGTTTFGQGESGCVKVGSLVESER